MKSVDDFLKDFNEQEASNNTEEAQAEEKKGEKVSKKRGKSYKSLVKTDKMYMWHPVYEIEFINGLKILWAKVDWKLIQLKPRERLYKDVVNDSLAKWMWDSATKTRNKWRQSYWDKYWFPEVNR